MQNILRILFIGLYLFRAALPMQATEVQNACNMALCSMDSCEMSHTSDKNHLFECHCGCNTGNQNQTSFAVTIVNPVKTQTVKTDNQPVFPFAPFFTDYTIETTPNCACNNKTIQVLLTSFQDNYLVFCQFLI